MWSRAELKSRAKVAFKRNYWKCVLVAFILSILSSSGAANTTTNLDIDELMETTNYYYEEGYFYDQDDIIENNVSGALVKSIMAVAGVIAMFSVIMGIFIFSPLEIGGCYFFTNNTYTEASPWDVVVAFKSGRYWKCVCAVFIRNLYIALWSLLLVIPGVIKSYEYRMVTYLLAEYPDMTREEAYRISKEMMRGQKMSAFILDLSFIGWYLLVGITCGIAGIFYVLPYVNATNAELYITLRNQYFYSNTYGMNYAVEGI